jgi:ABC-type multidrug transport system fused ATPase/permease subunit
VPKTRRFFSKRRILFRRRKSAPHGASALSAVRPFRARIGLTYTLTVIEDSLELAYPWATGLAIDGLLQHDWRSAIPIIVAWTARGAIGGFRKMYDTRVYTDVYNAIVTDTVLRQRGAGVDTTGVAARSSMAREFVTFFERDVPLAVTSIIGIFGSAAILFWYDLMIALTAIALFVPVFLINRIYSRYSYRVNNELNTQLEQEVSVIQRADPAEVRAHFQKLRGFRVKLSDAEAFNWTSVELLSIFVFIAILARAIFLPTTEAGDIYAILSYVWRLMENLDNVPQLVQQIARLVDIRRRIESGASIEAIGAELEKDRTEPE